MATVLFDFDGTLVRGDTFLGFCHWWLRRSPLHLAGVAGMAPWAIAGSLGLPPSAGRQRAASALLWAGTWGLHETLLARAMGAFVRERFGDARHVVRSSVDALRWHLRSGDRVVVVSGCETRLLRMVLPRIHISSQLDVVASELRPFAYGQITGDHCYGVRKVERLAAQLALSHWDLVYSDSQADLPLMRRSTQTTLVSPDPASRARCHLELGARVRSVDW